MSSKAMMQVERTLRPLTQTRKCFCNQMRLGIRTKGYHSSRRKYSNISVFNTYRRSIVHKHCGFSAQQKRQFSVFTIIRNVLKIRYLVLGAAGTAGVSAGLTYEKWKDKWTKFEDSVPQTDWIKQYYSSQFIDDVKEGFSHYSANVWDSIQSGKKLLFGVADGETKEVSEHVTKGTKEDKEVVEDTSLKIDPELLDNLGDEVETTRDIVDHDPDAETVGDDLEPDSETTEVEITAQESDAVPVEEIADLKDEPDEPIKSAIERTDEVENLESEWEPVVEDVEVESAYPPQAEEKNVIDPDLLRSHKKEVEKLRDILSKVQEELIEMKRTFPVELDRLQKENVDFIERHQKEEQIFQDLLSKSQEELTEIKEKLEQETERLQQEKEELINTQSKTRDELEEINQKLQTESDRLHHENENLILHHKKEKHMLQGHLSRVQEELLDNQRNLISEIDRLERENVELNKQIMMGKRKTAIGLRKMKRTLIDMYSDVLDLLAEYDSNYNIQDHLPRVVVVGDQSAGKTSVLEMVARARLFPRGSGQMMTRCPIMVTLTHGPNHVASFKGFDKEYDLTKERDLKLLREEVEGRMKEKLNETRTVSHDVLSMTVNGPGLPRMVLVDLPGMISTETTEMATNTKESIIEVSKHYMSNPNAIILCVQDGSLDAERSIVTDLASQMDPTGKRTIFVMTKMDQAEANLTDPTRIQKILSGTLFPMKAMGYYAVVTGSGNNDDSIEDIKEKEEEFFRKSKLFKTGVLKANQMTMQNLSFGVAKCFWQMIRESTEDQYELLRMKLFNLEAEWKNNYPTVRELDRDELFDKARSEILDEVLSLSQTRPHEWEDILSANLWQQIKQYAFEHIYIPAAQKGNPTDFKTKADILLKEWADRSLPDSAIQVGYSTLLSEFTKAMDEGVEIGGKRDAHSNLFIALKEQVKDMCVKNHNWYLKAKESLKVIQVTGLEDSNVPTKEQWDDAIKFMEDTLVVASEKTEQDLADLIGPGWKERWFYWTSRSDRQHVQNEIKKELDRLLFTSNDTTHPPELADDEVTAVKRNLHTNNVKASPADIQLVWGSLYRAYFLDRSLQGLQECRKAYYHPDLAKNELECNDLILFWRFRNMLQSTSNSLRQQIMNTEVHRLEDEVKYILDDIDNDEGMKKMLLQGKQVDLAEELKRVRHIQEYLEQFVEALKKEK